MFLRNFNTLLIIFLSVFIFLLCKGKSDKKKAEPEIAGEQTSPNTARVVGTIVEIDSTFRTGNEDGPSSKYPCKAVVRIDSMLGVGMGFPSDFTRGQKVTAIFKFTLMPTEKIFSNLEKNYPGLTVNSKFSAEIKVRQKLNKNVTGQHNFLIYGYKSLK